jgi:capsid portal protein
MAKASLAKSDIDIQQLKQIRKFLKKSDQSFGDQRRRTRARLKSVDGSPDNPMLVRQGTDSDDDPFTSLYTTYGLLQPRYDFIDLYNIVEESDILQICIDALVQGIDANGVDWQFTGSDRDQRQSDAAQNELKMLSDFFSNPNADGSFITVRKALRWDIESTGNGCLEILRNRKGFIEEVYHQPVSYMRMTPLQDEPTAYRTLLPRGGKLLELSKLKRFRKYARWLPVGTGIVSSNRPGYLKFFKEIGDPRLMSAKTGEYLDSVNQLGDGDSLATEILWFKHTFRNLSYGIPKWIGATTVIKGRILANYINWDLMNNQGVGPVMIIVEDGNLTDASFEEIENTLEANRGFKNFNKVTVLQVEPNLLGLGDQQTKSKVQIHKMRDARSEDLLFQQFLNYTEDTIRRCWRLPPLHTGDPKDFNNATSYSSMQTAEQFVFSPARSEFDEIMNVLFLRNEFRVTNWLLRSKAAAITGSEELGRLMGVASRSGGPSINQNVGMWNQALGTDWSTYDEAFYNLPAAVALGLVKLDRIDVDETGRIVILPPGQTLPGSAPTSVSLSEKENKKRRKAKKSANLLYLAMEQVEEQVKRRKLEPVENEDVTPL